MTLSETNGNASDTLVPRSPFLCGLRGLAYAENPPSEVPASMNLREEDSMTVHEVFDEIKNQIRTHADSGEPLVEVRLTNEQVAAIPPPVIDRIIRVARSIADEIPTVATVRVHAGGFGVDDIPIRVTAPVAN